MGMATADENEDWLGHFLFKEGRKCLDEEGELTTYLSLGRFADMC